MTGARVLDPRACELGEGAFWHPERRQAFWFDIMARRLMSTDGAAWDFDRTVTACGWIDRDRLLVASDVALIDFDLRDGSRRDVCALEADRPANRSNDGRADPMGGFWIGTMARDKTPGAGAIHRFHRGELRVIRAGVTIPNAICFAPGGRRGYFSDTKEQRLWTVALDADGWPEGDPQLFLDLSGEGLNPDGAVTDAEGRLWIAQWGAGRVACHAADGSFLRAVDVPAMNPSCPAFMGDRLDRLMVTTAREDLAAPSEDDGRTFVIDAPGAVGRPEPRVVL
ncbi:SMP-30/gluconolactonase/LRE family protein [Paracoccus aeridis]|uniref:SMP-30/gluconolactonase/LRE family protein n=1 Tax=Paracoccus aeridis TaxID=1966466 RepID=UPI0010AA800E|nr:SMP-30/gluconolactonase/LRE family protein [Paracoccus aeridis]